MRLSFHPSPETENVANWVVYHARGQGIKEEVVLEKHASENSPLEKKQLFYSFEGGILGRTGLDFLVPCHPQKLLMVLKCDPCHSDVSLLIDATRDTFSLCSMETFYAFSRTFRLSFSFLPRTFFLRSPLRPRSTSSL
jgi:hypothetical protein